MLSRYSSFVISDNWLIILVSSWLTSTHILSSVVTEAVVAAAVLEYRQLIKSLQCVREETLLEKRYEVQMKRGEPFTTLLKA